MNNRKFCGNCGAAYADTVNWPRNCEECGDVAWKNPIPVTFVLQVIIDPTEKRVGLAIAQRANNPGANQWAFIGGFVDIDDSSLEEAARREFREETGLELPGNASIIHSELNGWGQMVVAVYMDSYILYEDYLKGVVCPENLQLGVMWDLDQVELCFPIHQKIAERWFKDRSFISKVDTF